MNRNWRCTCGGEIGLTLSHDCWSSPGTATYTCPQCWAIYEINNLRCIREGDASGIVPLEGIIIKCGEKDDE